MKSITIFFFFLIASVQLQAQVSKGSYMVGGTGSYEHVKNAGNRLTVQPGIGYFVNRWFVPGIGLGLERSTSNGFGQTTTSFAPFTRLYLSRPRKVMIFGEAQHAWTRLKTDDNGWVPSSKGRTFRVGGGLDFFFNDSVAFETSLSWVTQHVIDSYTEKKVVFAFGLQLFL